MAVSAVGGRSNDVIAPSAEDASGLGHLEAVSLRDLIPRRLRSRR